MSTTQRLLGRGKAISCCSKRMKIRPWVSWKNQTWLIKQEAFTLHRQINRKLKRRTVVVPFMDYQWGADTAVVRSYMDNNSGYGFILLVIDFFSRYVWTKPLQSAKGSEMVDALRSILAMGRNPMTLFTDKGKEYCNSNVRNVLKQRGIDNFAS